ncbi:hypothetical protein [Argonema galeatum]|uniref:hypothetical protein n=1 Tax=Argonema galeatum TaxID=2942762 RepID=UPI0020120BE7|nr:hypothetical protein [Argonema galeatum]MCL1466820.1 hypothetical protein [Argonema galeatum A003/A1]
MAYWIKINYERKEYVIDLDRVCTFSYELNGRITFWLPDSSFPIVINPQGHPEAHQKVLSYIQEATGHDFESYWVKIYYERNDYLINLKFISTFSCEQNGRITFWLPDNAMPIVIHPQTNLEAYEKVISYIKQITGYTLP